MQISPAPNKVFLKQLLIHLHASGCCYPVVAEAVNYKRDYTAHKA